ncbi:MAG TPA: GWxTD domain-containing protein [Thermoanaerobaculia bacterium]|nr:GWxTD domain-containing protein [Thermoanaerobaculia bacterium]
MNKHGPVLLLLPLLLAAGCGGGTVAAPSRSRAELINPALGPDYSAWMVGAASRLATPEEVNEFLTLKDDQQAESFVERFWQQHNPTPNKPVNPLRQEFERRSANADRQFSEAGLLGRRSDRGTIYVLYGLPKKIDHEVSPVRNGPSLEVWIYGTDAPSGLDGRRPSPLYRFVKNGDVTVLYQGRVTAAPLLPPVEEPPL